MQYVGGVFGRAMSRPSSFSGLSRITSVFSAALADSGRYANLSIRRDLSFTAKWVLQLFPEVLTAILRDALAFRRGRNTSSLTRPLAVCPLRGCGAPAKAGHRGR